MKTFVVMCVCSPRLQRAPRFRSNRQSHRGQVRGAASTRGAVLKASLCAPPVGRRWRSPCRRPWAVCVKPLRLARYAHKSEFVAECSAIPGAQSSKEDCLYLNVWTPEWHGKCKNR
jgi:carboxylesterase type B